MARFFFIFALLMIEGLTVSMSSYAGCETSLVVREGEPEDLNAVRSLHEIFLASHAPDRVVVNLEKVRDQVYEDLVEAIVLRPSSQFLVLEKAKSTIAGFAMIRPSAENESRLEIVYLEVRPELYDRGNGTALLEGLLNHAKKLEKKTIRVVFSTQFTRAVKLFRSFGFKEIESNTDELLTFQLDL